VRLKSGIHKLGFEDKLEEGKSVVQRSLARIDEFVTKLRDNLDKQPLDGFLIPQLSLTVSNIN